MTTPSDKDLPSRRTALGLGLALAGAGLARADQAQAAPARVKHARFSGPLRSAGVMTLGAGNVLFVADITGAAVHAFALRDSDLSAQTGVVLGNFQNFEGADLVLGLDVKLAALMGTTYDNIRINDLVVHRPTQQVLLSVERGHGTNVIAAVVKVDHGRLEFLPLGDITHSAVAIPNEPGPTAMLEFEAQRVYAITDVKYHDGEIFVTGISNQRFASTLYRIPYPFTDTTAATTVEIWHPVHGEWETRAPIIRQHIQEIGGAPHLFAVYGCTPIVRFPLAVLLNGAHVRGDLIGQLGYGSNPLDMFGYTNPMDGKDYLVVTIDVRGGAQIAMTDLAAAPAERTGGPIDFNLSGVAVGETHLPIRAEHIAILDPRWAVVAWRRPKTAYRLDLGTMMVPYFFDRRFGMAEMNWPDGPDPFGYRGHRGELDRV